MRDGIGSSPAFPGSRKSRVSAARSGPSSAPSCASSSIRSISTNGRLGWISRFSPRPSAQWFGTAMPIERSEFLGVGFDPLPRDRALARLAEVTAETAYGYVVTPNVDHIVRLHED